MNIKRNSDPFKKYWWVLLLIFGAVGGWVCLPLLDLGVGSGAGYQGSHGLNTAEQSLDSLGNPQGAPGQALNLSMDGAYRKKAQAAGAQTSSLYQPPEGAAHASAASVSASANLADALKAVSKKSGPSGWGGAAHEGGFNAPRANFSGLSGLDGGRAGGSGSGASLSLDSFATAKPEVGMTTTRGLGAPPLGSTQAQSRAMGSLQTARSRSMAAVGLHSGDAASSLASSAFDGNRGGTEISASPQGGAYANLDAVPMNLKPNNPDANKFDYNPVPGLAPPKNTDGEMMKMMLMSIASMVIGGLIGGIPGQIVSSVLMMGMMKTQNSASNVTHQTAGKMICQLVRRSYGPETRYS